MFVSYNVVTSFHLVVEFAVVFVVCNVVVDKKKMESKTQPPQNGKNIIKRLVNKKQTSNIPRDALDVS